MQLEQGFKRKASFLIGTRQLVVFGTGYWGQWVSKKYNQQIAFYIDNSVQKQGTTFYGKSVLSPDVLRELDREKYFVVVASDLHYISMAAQLTQLGFQKYKDFSGYTMLADEDEHIDAKYPVTKIVVPLLNYCNSHCTLCSIWKNKQDRRVFPLQDFEETLREPFLINLQSIELTGGELTLLPNFTAYVEAALSATDALDQLILTFNCIAVQRTMQYAELAYRLCKEHGVRLLINISLNGYGSVHDQTRGTPGNFKKAVEVLDNFRQLDSEWVTVSIGSRLVKSNIFEAEKFIHFLKRRTLQNHALLPARGSQYFSSFDLDEIKLNQDEMYQLKLIFHKMIELFPASSFVYEFALHKLATGISLGTCTSENGSRIMLTMDRTFSFCVDDQVTSLPYEKGGLEQSYYQNVQVLGYLQNVSCPHCYYYPCLQSSEQYTQYKRRESFWRQLFTLESYNQKKQFVLSQSPALDACSENVPTILITGWYGTETVGDKAILGGIIQHYRTLFPQASFAVTSMYPFITERTLFELELDAQVIPLYSPDCLRYAQSADITVMGGGPLMEMELLSIPLWLFSIARQSGKQTVVFGCGIGPLKTERGTEAVAEILQLADEISVRDQNSGELAKALSGRQDIAVVADPAVAYLRDKYRDVPRVSRKKGVLACFLREITPEYFDGCRDEYLQWRCTFEKALGNNIKQLCREHDMRPFFYSMHNFVVGGDDRDFYYRFVHEQGFEEGSYDVYNHLTSIDVVHDAMIGSELCLCMRFHSVVFADTLGASYLAIDYTGGGKVKAFLQDQNQSDRLISREDLTQSEQMLCHIIADLGDRYIPISK